MKPSPLNLMKRIIVGVCSTRHDDRFWDSFFKFMKDCSVEYDINAIILKNQFLPYAQNSLADSMIMCRADYLLLLDDDQWGHTKEMLDCLINADAYVATMKTYSRHYPYCCALMAKLNDNGLYVGIENGEGYKEVDMCGFPMTLIKRELFEKLEKPYFTAVEALDRNWHTDLPFYNRLAEIGIKPIGCFQHCLNHDKVTQDNVMQLRDDESRERNNRVLLDALFLKHQEFTRQQELVGKV